VDPDEAELLSVTAHTTSRSLAREYRIVLNPEFSDFLINIGLRQRVIALILHAISAHA